MAAEIFDSCIRSQGDLAGVFEYDGLVGYFYLYDSGGKPNTKIVDAIHIVTGDVDFEETDVSIRWNATEDMVGLYIRKGLWAIFDTIHNQKHGGNYRYGEPLTVPDEIIQRFDT